MASISAYNGTGSRETLERSEVRVWYPWKSMPMRSYLPAITALVSSTAFAAETGKINPVEAAAAMKRVADWQLANPSKRALTDWVVAPLYLGLLDLHRVTGDAKYLQAVKQAGEQSDWQPGLTRRYGIDHADDHAVLAAWIEYDLITGGDRSIRFTRDHFKKVRDYLADKPAAALAGGTFTWCWCDALFMSPPVWTLLSKVTKESEYLAWSDKEWWTTTDVLYNPAESFYYRDNNFFEKRTPSGKLVFWSRGNGWVVSGLTRVLDHLPEDHPSRRKYLSLYFSMMERARKVQGGDGLWRASLLEPGEAEGESSGTAFFVHALAWGLNRGLLGESEFRPALEKGWAALCGNIQEDGRLGFCQRIGDAPEASAAQTSEPFGTGAFLLAGSEILRGIDPSKKRSDVASFKDAKHPQRYKREESRVVVKFVPERKDDFIFENDFVAFRAYGPALRASVEDSGFDAWFKRVSWPIMEKRYIEDRTKLLFSKKAKPYHEDQGEGLDAYKVGDSRGCGGIGVWDGNAVHKSDTYTAYRIISQTPENAVFELDYASDWNGKKVMETKRISLTLGDRFFECESTFTVDGKAGEFPVAIGLKAQSSVTKSENDEKRGFMSISDTVAGEFLGQGIWIDPKLITKFHKTGDTSENAEYVCITKTDAAGKIKWRAGYAWGGGGIIMTEEAWHEYLRNIAATIK